MANAWKKIEPYEGRGDFDGRSARTTFAVRRLLSNPRNVQLVIPDGKASAARADVYSDGNGKLAVRFSDRGDRAVFKSGKHARASHVTFPAMFADKFPFGTTDVSVAYEGGMLVIDTAQFAA